MFLFYFFQIGEGEKLITTVLLNGERLHVRVHVSFLFVSELESCYVYFIAKNKLAELVFAHKIYL